MDCLYEKRSSMTTMMQTVYKLDLINQTRPVSQEIKTPQDSSVLIH